MRINPSLLAKLLTYICSAVVLVACFDCFASAGESPVDPTRARRDQSHRTVTQIRLDSESFIKKLRETSELESKTPIILDLCWLHQEIVVHPYFETSTQLQSVRSLIANQLRSFLKELRATDEFKSRVANASDGNSNRKSQRPRTSSNRRSNSNQQSTAEEVAQLDSNSAEEAIQQWSNRSGFLASRSLGGASQFFGFLDGNFAPPWDHGEELVKLIETTINKDLWQSNGGEGVIHYYRPSRILVVSATTEAHDSMTDFLQLMREISR